MMANATSPIGQSSVPAVNTPSLLYAQATEHTKSQQIRAANNAALILQVALASAGNNSALGSDLFSIDNNLPNLQTDVVANESLINLDTTTFLLLNKTISDLGVTGIGGNLTSRQVEASDILQQDVLGLEEAAIAPRLRALTNEASTVDLSPQAQAIASSPVAVSPTASSDGLPALAAAQLQKFSAIIAPLANLPLTSTLLQQIQIQLAAAQLPAQLLTLNSIFLVQNYLGRENQADSMESINKGLIAPVSAVDASSGL